jgi:acetyl-CoA carboxylase biotin carboxyl carrier protein
VAADDASKNAGPFDVRTVKALVALMAQHDLSEIDLREGTQRICLRRGSIQSAAGAGPATISGPPASVPAAPLAPPKNDAPSPSAPTKKLIEIKSPTPGTFYGAANPESPPFVKVGARVTPTTVVCLIEAMKIFNEITADCTGTITEILSENQQPVEYGQVLFRVDPTS